MKNLCVTFEEWYIGDGTYPPLKKRQNVNLAFYVRPYNKTITTDAECFFRQLKNSEYEFSGQIIREFIDTHNRLVVIDTQQFLFYIELEDTKTKTLEGQFIIGKGELLIDYYIWSEFYSNYENVPDLFYSFEINKMRMVKIPEKFIQRQSKGMSSPTSLSTNDYNEKDIIEIENMNENKSSTSFFLLDLKPINEKIERTFL